jgi:hypothetical protein
LPAPEIAAGLNRLALFGQVIHDLSLGVYRWRQVMPAPLTESQIGSDDTETTEGRLLLGRAKFEITRDERSPTGTRLIQCSIHDRQSPDRNVEMVVDADGRIVRGQCKCSHHFQAGLRRGACRHLQAVRNHLFVGPGDATLDAWYKSFWN